MDESHHWQEVCFVSLIRSLRSGLANIRMHKIIAFIEQWLTLVPGQGICEAVAEVQIRSMTTAFSIVAISLPRNVRLLLSYWLENNLKAHYQIV